MPSTNWTGGSTNSTNFEGNSTWADEVTRLNSTIVTLGSLVVYLLGFTPGRNMINSSPSTDFTNGSTNSTNFANGSLNSTTFTKGSVNSTNWA